VLARLLFETAVKIDAVFEHLCDVDRGTELAHKASGVEGGPAGQLAFVEKDHVLPSHGGEMVSNATACNTSSDNDHPCSIFHALLLPVFNQDVRKEDHASFLSACIDTFISKSFLCQPPVEMKGRVV
jgi:hypothetical protein